MTGQDPKTVFCVGRKEAIMPLGVIEDKLVANPGFPVANPRFLVAKATFCAGTVDGFYLDSISLCVEVVNLLLLPPNLVSQLLLLVCERVRLSVQPPVNCSTDIIYSHQCQVLIGKNDN